MQFLGEEKPEMQRIRGQTLEDGLRPQKETRRDRESNFNPQQFARSSSQIGERG